MRCPHCANRTPKRSLFCGVCGQRIARRCPRCDKRVHIRFSHCTRCGLALGEGVTRRQDDKVTEADHRVTPSPPHPVTLSSSPIDRYLPPELAAKLEAARSSGAEGERRVVTILFCDIKGSTALAEQMDPEEWTEVVNDAFERMIRPVYKYEGTVARLMGDGILAFFGAPIAHEDDPQRAILAALDILSNFTDAPIHNSQFTVHHSQFPPLLPRIGINTGLVVVGAVGSDLRMEYTAMGDAINLAARMEQTAEPGTIQIAEATWRLTAPLFDCEELGPVEVKGKAAPVRAWRVIGRKAAPGRLRGIEGLEAPLIGREREWQSLGQAAQRAQKGVGSVIFLVGEAGLGKSRLIRELKKEIGDWRLGDWEIADGFNLQSPISQSPISFLETAAFSYETAQPYALFQRLVRCAAGIGPGDGPEESRARLAHLAAALPEEEQTRRVLFTLFGLGDDDGPRLEGESFRGQLFVVAEQLWRLWAGRPLALICDDIHWIDPASAALLQHLLPLTAELPLLLLCATRPDENSPGWSLLTHAQEKLPHCTTRLDVRPLSPADSNRLIDSLLAIDDLPPAVRGRILDNADGNPFFVEEVVRALLETGAIARREGQVVWCLEEDDPELHIPGSLQALITARIDRLDEAARRTLQLAALIGRNFYLRVLQAIAESGLAVDEQVAVLQRAELIREIARIPEREYNFRHALTQEAAYRTILRKERRAFHRRVAQAIEALFPEQVAEQAAALAWHYAEAEENGPAIHYYALAGHAAFRLYAAPEALTHYNRAVELARSHAWPGTELADDLLAVYANRGRALELVLDFEGAVANYREMERLGDQAGDSRFCLAGWLAEATIRAIFTPVRDPTEGRRLAEAALALARRQGDPLCEAKALWNLLLVDSFGGSTERSIACGEAARAICNRYENDPAIGQPIRELKAVLLNDLFRPYLFSSQLQTALALNEEAQALLREQGNLPQLATALINIAVAYFELGRFADSRASLAEANRVSRSIGNLGGEVGAGFLVGYMYGEEGRIGEALEAIEHYIQLGRKTGQIGEVVLNQAERCWLQAQLGDAAGGAAAFGEVLAQTESIPFIHAHALALAAQAELRAGRVEQAARWIDEAEELLVGAFWFFALHFIPLVRAEVALAQGNGEEALAVLERLRARAAEVGSRAYRYDIELLYGQALLAAGRREEAVAAFHTGLAVADELGARRTRWQLLRALAAVSEDAAEAARLHAAAQADIDWIAGQIPNDELRLAFARLTEYR